MTTVLMSAAAVSLGGLVAAIGLPGRARAWVAGLLIATLSGIGVIIGGWTLGATTPISVGPDPFTFSLEVDALSGIFLIVIGLVGVPAALFGIRYAHSTATSRTMWASLVLFVASMQLVVVASSVLAFLTAWELMALSSLLLVLCEHRDDAATRAAGLWYAAMTQLGFLLIAGVLLTLGARAGSGEFSALDQAASGFESGARGLLFVLAAVGFCSKSGVVPFHVWLPRAHPAAPSHVSSIMSGAMVSLGIYGLLRIGVQILGPVQIWWAVLLLALGSLSAAYGALRAAVATDIKKVLAFSTSENVGLVLIGIGAGVLLLAQDQPGLASVAFAAALLHTLNHGVFKTLLFLGAGAVHHATGHRNLDDLGGLVTRMPTTTALFGIGALAAAALPVGNGFVSEWLLLQSLVNGQQGNSVLTAVLMPITVAVVAVTTGLAVAAFVKTFGIGFLARPRTRSAQKAREVPVLMRISMGLAALLVLTLGLIPALLVGPINAATKVLAPLAGPPLQGYGTGLAISGTQTQLSPLILAAIVGGFGAILVAAVRLSGRKRRRDVPLWGGGGIRTSPRMQYTAVSFAEPLVRVFDSALLPTRDIDAVEIPSTPLLERRVRFSQQISDWFEDRVYGPMISAAKWWSRAGRIIANGSINRYLGYVFIALIVVATVTAL